MSQRYEYILEPLKVGGMDLPNRIVFEDATRCRTDMPSRTPTPLTAQYYAQRAGVGLILTEPLMVAKGHSAYYYEPGMYSDAQRVEWATVALAVHASGGRIVAVLDHGGRQCHSINDGEKPIAPVAVAANGTIPAPFNRTHLPIPYEVPRAMNAEDVASVVASFEVASRLAVEAGMDGVEIIACYGHLFHQFIDPTVNTRNDKYAGDIAGRCRALMEVLVAVCRAVGPQRVGVRVDPLTSTGSPMDDLLPYLGAELVRLGVAYLHVVHAADGNVSDAKRYFRGPVVASGDFLTPSTAEAAIASRRVDVVAFGPLVWANPDLVERLRIDAPLSNVRWPFAQTRGAEGYVDYSVFEED